MKAQNQQDVNPGEKKLFGIQNIDRKGAEADAAAGQHSALCGWSFGKSCPDSYRDWFFWVKPKERKKGSS